VVTVDAEPISLLSNDELRGRVERLQGLMAEEGFDALICFGAHRDYAPADLWYLARWTCIDEETSYLFVPRDGPTTLVTDAEWDEARARVEAVAGDVLFDPDPVVPLGRLSLGHVREGGRIGLSGWAMFPAPIYVRLAAAAAGIDLVDATELTERQRMVKSPTEIELLRRAAHISDLGMAAGLEVVAEGVTELAVAAAAEAAIRGAGAEISFTTIVGSGARTALTTFLPSSRRIETGDLLVLDCGARVAGYHGDMCRAVVAGKPNDEQRRMLEATRDGVEAAIDAIRPGVLVRDVQRRTRSAAEAAGLGDHWWGFYMPHGVGAAQHEMPVGSRHGDLPLEAGMVLCIEPGIAVQGVGGVVLEQMVLVTENGGSVLNELPLERWGS
jgi:Xaa-Pro aminopeptidase